MPECVPTKIVCWNMDHRRKPWWELASMEGADVALLQETCASPTNLPSRIQFGPREHWDSHHWNSRWYEGRFPQLFDRWPMVVKLSDRVEIEWFKQVSPISETRCDEFAVSGVGTVAAARIRPKGAEPFIVVSMYARWMKPHPSVETNFDVGYADGSAHRIISDLSAFIGKVDPSSHRIIAAGDLNTIYGSKAPPNWTAARDDSIWCRMAALGFKFLGPQAPNGRQADQQPPLVPSDTKNVVTHYKKRGQEPRTADNQLDYVFASRGFHESIRTRALNSVRDWGDSDHCRLLIEVNG